jgi:flagellar motor switch protein FliM
MAEATQDAVGSSQGASEDQKALMAEWDAMSAEDTSEDAAEQLKGASSRHVLEQPEIESLLGGDGHRSGVKAIVDSGLVSYERLPMLEVVFDRLARMMSTSLRNFTSDNVEVSLASTTSWRFGDYLDSIPLPAMITVFKAEEWDNFGLMTVDSSLIYLLVDVLLGGSRGTAAISMEGRPYTTIERNLVERMVRLVLGDLSAAFDPLSPVTFRFERLESNPRFATIARPANAAIAAKLRVEMEDRGGCIEMILPYATLEPVRELLLQMFIGEKFGHDSIWESHLTAELWQTEVAIQAVLEEVGMRLGDVLSWTEGTRLDLNCGPNSKVRLRCGDVDMFEGQMGRKASNIAVRIVSKLMVEGETD